MAYAAIGDLPADSGARPGVVAPTWMAVNRYESQLLCRGIGRTIEDLSHEVQAPVVTHGARGSGVWRDGAEVATPATAQVDAVDPTGGSDAYRAGLVMGLLRDADWADSAWLAPVFGAMAVECHGTQNHRPDRDMMAPRYEQTYEQTYEQSWIW